MHIRCPEFVASVATANVHFLLVTIATGVLLIALISAGFRTLQRPANYLFL